MRCSALRTLCVSVLSFVVVFGWCLGCSSSSESAHRDTLTADVGKYPPAPAGITQPRVGVPPFKVQGTGAFSGGDVNDLAADQMTTLLDQSDRFKVIERAQLTKLLDEQNLEGIVKPGELARPGQVRGVDYLLIGRVTNLRVKNESHNTGFGLAKISNIASGAVAAKHFCPQCGKEVTAGTKFCPSCGAKVE